MKVSYSWLKDYVDCNLSAEEVSDKLTFCGLEVETLEKEELVKGGLKGVVVGEVLTCEAHPNSDHLHVTKVNIGGDTPLDIVCGAPNVAAGQKVAVATIGTTLFFGEKPITIKKGKLRGCVSEGMICAEDELCLGTSHDGIMVLDPSAVPGTPLKEFLGLNDEYGFEIGLTANRSDATGHIGVTRDLCALLSLDNYNAGKKEFVKLKMPDVSSFKADNHDLNVKITVEDSQACLRYAGVSVSGVTVAESPEWLKKRLMSIGLKPINNVVDISNFVLFETGHPLHTFDADKIGGKHIIVKKLPQDTVLRTLDGVDRKLSSEDLIICDENEGMVIAGVFGGEKSGISENTTNVFIEAAVFDPPTIRKTAKRHGLQTDASFRYERGVDPEMTIFALKRAALLIKEIAGGKISSEITDVYPNPIPRKQVTLLYDRVNRLIGKEIPKEEIIFILQSMDFDIVSHDNDQLVVGVPTAKYDVYREADVIEEVLRIYGYNNIEIGREQNFTFGNTPKPDPEKVGEIAGDFLCDNGYMQIMNNSLCAEELSKLVPAFAPENNVRVLNPLSKELNIMRRSLIFGGLQSIIYNINRKVKGLKFFEFGNVYSYHPEFADSKNVDKKYEEVQHLAIFATGNYVNESWYAPKRDATFFDLKSDTLRLLHRIGIDMKRENEEEIDGIFGKTLLIKIDKTEVAQICEVPQNLLDYYDIKQNVFFSDILWANALKLKGRNKISFSPLPKFNDTRRDLAIVVDKQVKYSDIVNITRQKGGKTIKSMNLFDVYEGITVGAGKKSYAIAYFLRDDDKTLTDEQIEKTMTQLINLYGKEFGATIR
ncbi:MAG: phenylalanine--tRNA ligase subunit beta [Bacteroidales bacterium]|nr:phenylalanine--tRNA ligase subunit beta [Bacteroidales bacterium]